MARVLIVEDEPLISMMLKEWLTELGHDPLGPAETITDALHLINTAHPAIVILDINLRGERCEPVAEVLAERSVPIAFATGANGDALVNKYPKATTISKPYDYDSVKKALDFLAVI